MIQRTVIPLLLIMFCLPGLVLGGDEPPAKPMTLEECLVRALEDNLGLKVQVLNPELADLAVAQAGEKFLPRLGFQYSRASNQSASFSLIESSASKSYSFESGLSQQLPTGGLIQASLSSGMTDTNVQFQTINPYYSSQLLFSLDQPLLKDFGLTVSRKEILIARNNRDIAENDFRAVLLDTLYAVQEAYWNLVFSIDDYQVRRQSLGLARDLLERNRRELEIGMMAPVDIVTAEAEVASREADLLQAEVLIKNREDALRTLLNFGSKEGESGLMIQPIDRPAVGEREVSVEGALAVAMTESPDLQSSRVAIKSRDLDLLYARNQLLPDLSLQAYYWSPAVSGTQILYLDDNPLTGVVIGTIPGGSSQALKDAVKFKYRNWSVNLTLSLPLNTIFSRAAAAEAEVNLEQARLALQDKEQQVFLGVRSAVREVQNNAQRVEAYRAALKLAERKLEAEEKKVKVGLSTNYTLLQMQRDLASAQSQELQSRIDYVLSLALLDKTTGAGLEKWNIKLDSAGQPITKD
jgi:outer membrane protein TolC